MSQGDKSTLYAALKEAGWEPDKHYRDYSTDDLVEIAANLTGQEPVINTNTEHKPGPTIYDLETPPVSATPTNERPGQRVFSDMNTPVRTDPDGKVWYAEEVRKPATPKPRARRKLSYIDPGTKTQGTQVGQFTESFEVAGDQQRTEEVKITLPTYQVGIYKDPKHPFKIHVYNGNRGYDLFEVRDYYGGDFDLVPSMIKRTYVGNTLCYDIRSTIRAIEEEARQLSLKGQL